MLAPFILHQIIPDEEPLLLLVRKFSAVYTILAPTDTMLDGFDAEFHKCGARSKIEIGGAFIYVSETVDEIANLVDARRLS